MLIAIKLVLTLCVSALALSPLLVDDWSGGVFREVTLLGPVYGSIFVAVFLILVALYCVDLQRLLRSAPEPLRAAPPRSVWWMFLIPYNFIEDFFIVHNVTQTIRRAARTFGIEKLKAPYGALSGFGWSTLQIITLVPHRVGSIASVAAFVLWFVHWAFVRRASRIIKAVQAV